MNKKMKEILKAQLIRHEGKRYRPYRDSVGKLTVGVGRNIDDVPFSEDEIMLMLENDISHAIEDASKFLWYIGLDEVRQSVIVNMLFNMGMEKFTSFRKMIKALEQKKYVLAAKEMLDSKWAAQVENRAHELAGIMERGK